jgi:hypothetical protein
MHELIGHQLALDEGDYEIVEVRHVGHDMVVYVEPKRAARAPVSLGRTAFRYTDVAAFIDRVRSPAPPA